MSGVEVPGSDNMRFIDVHNHFYPREYLLLVKSIGSAVRVTEDADGNPQVHYPGDYNVVVKGHRDIEYRQRVLEQEDVALQVLSFTTPGTHVEAPATALSLARSINDAFASIIAARPARFSALANLPLNDPQASVVELERAVRELRLPGAMIFSNVNGIPLSSERYWPLYERANDLDAVLYIHPTYPVGVESMLDFWLMPLLGFPFDTTLAISKLVLTGILDRYPRIKWVLGHLGGTIPFLAERLDRGFHAFRECRTHIDRPPSEYFKRCYFDTVNFDDAALALALAFAGPRQLLAGSDYPHLIGSIPMMRAGVERLPASDEVKAQIAGGNAARIFGLAGSAAG